MQRSQNFGSPGHGLYYSRTAWRKQQADWKTTPAGIFTNSAESSLIVFRNVWYISQLLPVDRVNANHSQGFGAYRMKCEFILSVLLLFCSMVFAQSNDATISGGVTDPSGKFIQGADVEIANDATGVVYSSRTNGSGMYVVPILPPGRYHLQVSKPGFTTIIKADVVLNIQTALALNIILPVGSTSESITVDAGSSAINTTDGSVSTVIDQKFVKNIPLNGRSFQDLISLTPGVVTQSPQNGGSVQAQGDFSVNGQRTESNYYMIDGIAGNIE